MSGPVDVNDVGQDREYDQQHGDDETATAEGAGHGARRECPAAGNPRSGDEPSRPGDGTANLTQ